MRQAAWWSVGALVVGLSGAGSAAQTPQAGEDVARRQLESGRAFARQGNYAEAIKDFQAVAETHASTSVADDAWLELARYHFDVAHDRPRTQAAVDAILTNYATSDSAPAAYVLAGRLAMAASRQPDALTTALANFDRVSRLFPTSDAVPEALHYAGVAMLYNGQFDQAIARLGRVNAEYSTSAAAAEAYLTASLVLVAMGDPVLAMEELQQVRNRWPGSPAAATALDRLTLLHRLYVRAPAGTPYRGGTEVVGPQRLENIVGMTLAGDGRVVWATETGLGVAAPAGATRPTSVGRPRGLALQADGDIAVIEGNVLRPSSGQSLMFAVPESGGFKSLDRIEAAAQLSNGNWLIMDSDQRSLQRFGADTQHIAAFQSGRVERLAVTPADRIAGLDRDGREVFIFDISGLATTTVPLRTEQYDLRDARDIAFDAFGHLYVLDDDAVGVFTPYVPAGADSANTARALSYQLLTLFMPAESTPGRFDRARAFVVDGSGALFVYDDRAKRIQVYR
jgi:TolA-binding protein